MVSMAFWACAASPAISGLISASKRPGLPPQASRALAACFWVSVSPSKASFPSARALACHCFSRDRAGRGFSGSRCKKPVGSSAIKPGRLKS